MGLFDKIAHAIGDKVGDVMLDRDMYDVPRMSDDRVRDIICGREQVPAHIKASAIKEGFKRSLKD
ncbi:hypothetical protein [Aeromonas enteropelogenes]|uniref:hypothetical protein n=1 Tax=Aeromonas enteropelogenes TaxID=29489 RepID=UPI0039874DFF